MLFFNAEKITASFQKHYFKFVCVGVEFCKTVIWKKNIFVRNRLIELCP
jgi:hypothetical protein